MVKTCLGEVAGLLSAFLFFEWHLQLYEVGKPWCWVRADKFYMKISLIAKKDLLRVEMLVGSQSTNYVHK